MTVSTNLGTGQIRNPEGLIKGHKDLSKDGSKGAHSTRMFQGKTLNAIPEALGCLYLLGVLTHRYQMPLPVTVVLLGEITA